MNVKITRDWTKSFFVMIVAVIIMGMCVSLLVMCDMGTDPFNMNLRIGILIPALILFILAAAIYMEQHRMMQYLFLIRTDGRFSW